MNTVQLIGRKIIDILVYTKMEHGGLDQAEISMKLEDGSIVGIPWNFESSNLNFTPRKEAASVFTDLKDIEIYHVNKGGKTIGKILEDKKKSNHSISFRIKKAFHRQGQIPKEYQPYKIEYQVNPLKFIQNQTIADILMLDYAESTCFIELENGYIFTENSFAPHGTGLAGLNIYKDLEEFEQRFGTEYRRIIN